MYRFSVAFLIAGVSLATLAAQTAIPTREGRGGQAGQPGQGRRGGGPGPEVNLPAVPVAVTLPTISAEITGPGPSFESLMALKPGDDMAHFKYEAHEYFVSGTANGEPYTTRIVVRRPADAAKFSGLVLAESMHPSGNAWMFHFTHTYSMSAGHIGLDILTSTHVPFAEFNPERYRTLRVGQGQATEILAQVGALTKSQQQGNPLAGLPVREMILAGTSASAAVLINYLPGHMVLRLPDMKPAKSSALDIAAQPLTGCQSLLARSARLGPLCGSQQVQNSRNEAHSGPIYDGFLPTSTGATIRQVDVPMIQVPTMTEVMTGTATARQDGDEPGNQFRVYEFPGMAHIDSRDAAAYYPNPCKLPISRFPLAAYMSVALNHLWQWVDKGAVPPKADRILVDRNATNDGSLMALDEHGNARGGIRNVYVDVPVKKYGVRNEGAVPPIPNAHPFVAVRGEAAQNQLCGLAGYEVAFSQADLKKLYKDKKNYVRRVERSLDDSTRQGWFLPVYRSVVLADAAAVVF